MRSSRASQEDDLTKLIRPRRLWYECKRGTVRLDETGLLARPEPLVILGDAGMGKTELTRSLVQCGGGAWCTARQVLRRGARALHGDATTLVIDALDEVGIKGEGDAVDLVLTKLGEAGFPRFVLTCRVADWRSATAASALTEDYPDRKPLVLHLEPLSEEDIVTILADRLPSFGGQLAAQASEVIEHFRAHGLDGLLGNPQTLELIARTAADGALPETKSALFAKAVDVLRREHRGEKIALQTDEASALSAAGAAFAALVLTGADAVVRQVAEPHEDELPWAEVAALPGAEALGRVIGSRLFEGSSAERFTYWHRRIGEYLGARWLASSARSALGRQRLLQLFHADALVPASLRGLHAWLAHQGDSDLAVAVIRYDPMGVVEYGDCDALGAEEARALLDGLADLAQRDPYFRERKSYAITSVMRSALLTEVRALIVDRKRQLGLRALLLDALPGSQLADALRADVRRLLLDRDEVFAVRSSAADALIALGGEDWEHVWEQLLEEGSGDSVRLALEAADDLVGLPLSDDLLARLAVRRAGVETQTTTLLFHLMRALPDARLDGVLDAYTQALPRLGKRHERPNNEELTDFGFDLIARRLKLGHVEPLRLWRWLRPFDAAVGFAREARHAVHEHLRSDDISRRAIQAHVLFDEPNDKTLWERSWRLASRSSGLRPTNDDVLLLFDRLDQDERADERWQDLVHLARHSPNEGEAVRERAKMFVADRPDMVAWIDGLAPPQVPEWQIKQDEERRQRDSKRASDWREHRIEFEAHVEDMRRGADRWLVDPALAYLKLLNGIGRGCPAHERVAQWLGEELGRAAHEGFVAFLLSSEPPTAQQVADSHAEPPMSREMYIVIAGVAERWRCLEKNAFTGVSDDRLLIVFHEIRRVNITEDAGIVGLLEAVSAEIERRGLWEFAARQWIEPQLARRRDHVDKLYELMRDKQRSALASALAAEWLDRFPQLKPGPEAELIDRLLRDGRFDALRALEASRRQDRTIQRQANWDAVAFVVDFDAQRERLEVVATTNIEWFWTLRDRVGGGRRGGRMVRLTVDQLAWLFATFREAFPQAGYPSGGWAGDTNPWDASEFLLSIASRLADETSEGAERRLAALCAAPADGYTDALRHRAVEQARKAVQERYRPVLLPELRAVVDAKPPASVADLQATMLALLAAVQARIASSPEDAWSLFYDDRGQPRNEERCRDRLLTMLGPHPEEIELLPEGHLADNKRADIIALRSCFRLPVEIKGQWHDELWRAAESQLERFYAADYAADRRGIYLVLWFGHAVENGKKPRARAVGQRRPQNPQDLLDGLVAGSEAARGGRIRVVVLDLSRP